MTKRASTSRKMKGIDLMKRVSFTLVLMVCCQAVVLSQTVTHSMSGHQPFEDSPFGFHPASVSAAGYPNNGFVDAQFIGVHWHRPPVYAYWFQVQPDQNSPTYDWRLLDQQYSAVPQGINILANIAPDHPRSPHGYTLPSSYIPIDEDKYAAFVRATVERYDGDGLDDMLGLTNPIKHWQVGNEPSNKLSGFADLQRMTYQAIKEVCRECTVLIGGAAGFPDNYVLRFDSVYLPILAQLAGQYVHVFGFHWYGMATGDYRLRDSVTGEDVYQHVRNVLTTNGFPPDLPIWITEMGSYSGDPIEPEFPFQTERQQASDYLKRFVYSLSRGVKKIFPAFGLMEGFIHNDGYFDHTGLIYNGRGSNDLGLGVKKLGYYTYKLMTEKLEESDWQNIQTVHEQNGVYLYKFSKQGKPIWVAWNDSSDTRTITISGITSNWVEMTEAVPKYQSGKDVTDYGTAFQMDTLAVVNGSVSLQLAEKPVFVEELIVTSVGDEVNSIPKEFVLYQNYPNPFNPTTTIRFSIPQHSQATLKIFDVLGREVATLVDEYKDAGMHTVVLGTRNLALVSLPSGVYFYKLQSGDFVEVKKMILIR